MARMDSIVEVDAGTPDSDRTRLVPTTEADPSAHIHGTHVPVEEPFIASTQQMPPHGKRQE